jgi:hypothetical protein
VFPHFFDEMMRGMQSTSIIEASPRTGCISILFKEQEEIQPVRGVASIIVVLMHSSHHFIEKKRERYVNG